MTNYSQYGMQISFCGFKSRLISVTCTKEPSLELKSRRPFEVILIHCAFISKFFNGGTRRMTEWQHELTESFPKDPLTSCYWGTYGWKHLWQDLRVWNIVQYHPVYRLRNEFNWTDEESSSELILILKAVSAHYRSQVKTKNLRGNLVGILSPHHNQSHITSLKFE